MLSRAATCSALTAWPADLAGGDVLDRRGLDDRGDAVLATGEESVLGGEDVGRREDGGSAAGGSSLCRLRAGMRGG